MKTVLLSYWADFEKLMIKIIRVKSQCLMMGSKYPWVDFIKVQLEPHAGWLVFELVICGPWLCLFFCMLVEGSYWGWLLKKTAFSHIKRLFAK